MLREDLLPSSCFVVALPHSHSLLGSESKVFLSHWLSCHKRELCHQQSRHVLAPFLSYVTNVLCLGFSTIVKSSIKQEGARGFPFHTSVY